MLVFIESLWLSDGWWLFFHLPKHHRLSCLDMYVYMYKLLCLPSDNVNLIGGRLWMAISYGPYAYKFVVVVVVVFELCPLILCLFSLYSFLSWVLLFSALRMWVFGSKKEKNIFGQLLNWNKAMLLTTLNKTYKRKIWAERE